MTLLTIDKSQQIRSILRSVAAEHILPYRGGNIKSVVKEGDSIQTPADINAEEALTEKLRELFPKAQIVGEEGVSEDETRVDVLNSSGIVFVIDPIDGTREYANGGKRYNTMLSMRVNGETIASWIYFPENNQLYFSEKGKGIFKDNGPFVEKINIAAAPQTPSEVIIMNGGHYKDNNPQLASDGTATITLKNVFKRVVESNRVAGFDFLQLLQGTIHSIIYAQGKLSDILPWEGFLNEMGYVLSDLKGNPYDPTVPKNGVIVAPNRKIQSEIAAIIS